MTHRDLHTPYGAVRWSDGTLPTDYGHTGQRADTTGLMYYHARYYDAALGRFVSADTVVPDPSRPRDLNRYAYAANSPLRFVDPSGHAAACSWGEGGCGAPLPPPPPPPPSLPYDITAYELGWLWFTEQCPERIEFDENYVLTQYLMRDRGVNLARARFYQELRRGSLTNGADDSVGYKYIPVDYLREAGEYVFGYDRVGFFLGSYRIHTHLNSDGTVTFTVVDHKTLESGSRSPLYYAPDFVNYFLPESLELSRSNYSIEGLLMEGQRPNLAGYLFGPRSFFERRTRSDPGPFGTDLHLGGNVELVFTWTEPLQVDWEK